MCVNFALWHATLPTLVSSRAWPKHMPQHVCHANPFAAAAGCYFLIDCPGQAELFTMHSALKSILDTLTGAWAYQLVAVALVDAHLCTDASK